MKKFKTFKRTRKEKKAIQVFRDEDQKENPLGKQDSSDLGLRDRLKGIDVNRTDLGLRDRLKGKDLGRQRLKEKRMQDQVLNKTQERSSSSDELISYGTQM